MGNLIKAGRVVTLTLKLTNNTGASIAAGTPFAYLSSGVYPTDQLLVPAVLSGNVIYARISYNQAGAINLNAEWTNQSTVYLSASYIVA